MSRRKHPAPEQKPGKREPSGPVFTVQLGLSGIVGIGAVLFCLFLWMFLIGIWAGQTILRPPAVLGQPAAAPPAAGNTETSRPDDTADAHPALEPPPEHPAEADTVVLVPAERKKRVAPPHASAETQ